MASKMRIKGTTQSQFQITPANAVGAPVAGAWEVGVLWMDSAGDLYRCVIAGTPGTWVGVAGNEITTSNINHVDVNGNNGTAQPNDPALPYLTIDAALTASASGDIVAVRPGTYGESGLTVPTGVTLVSVGGLNATTIGEFGAVAHCVTLSADALLQGFSIRVPSTIALAGVAHSTGTGTVYDLDFKGNGTTGLGDGLLKTGAGKVVGSNIRCSVGGMTNLLHVTDAVLALDDVHVPQGTGAIANAILTDGSGRFQGQGINIGNSNVTDCIHVEGTSTCIIYSPNWFNIPVGGHLAADGVSVTIIGGRVDATVASLLVDPALTGVGTTLTVSGTVIQPLFSFPAVAMDNMELSAQFHQESTTTRQAEARVVGSDLVTGFPELGSGLMVGKGSAYSDGTKVYTSDGTDTSTTVGVVTDVTSDAQSKTGSTFTFQGTAVDHCIYFAADRADPSGTELKHWGAKVTQVTAGVGGSYVVEIWDGAAWTAIGVMATSAQKTYRYANNLFLRASSNEFLQYGINDDTTWATSAIDGTTAYWVRWRVDTVLTTIPVFETAWLTPSHVMINAQGLKRALGLATWKTTIVSAGNVFGESGGVPTAKFDVGLGGVPTGWEHQSPNSLLDANGNAIYAQFALPGGICTAFPLEIEVIFSMIPGGTLTSPVIGFVAAIPIATAFNKVADPAGGIVPVQRAIVDTETTIAKAATSYTFNSSLIGTVWPADTFYKAEFGPYDISAYYSEDAVLVRMELDNDGSPNQDIAIIAMIVEGVAFTDGEV